MTTNNMGHQGTTRTPTAKSHTQSLSRKRILSELREIKNQLITLDVPFNTSSDEIGVRLSPMRSNLLEWHFSFTGISGSPYSEGIYHGRIMLHPEYPRKAPSICMLTPTGRWEVGKDICLSATAHHQETWNPSWNLRTLVMALRGYMVCKPGEIGSISTTADRQRTLALQSVHWACPICGVSHGSLMCIEGKDKTDRTSPQNEKSVLQQSGKKVTVTEDTGSGLVSTAGTIATPTRQQPNEKMLKQHKRAREQIQLHLQAIQKKRKRLALIRTFLLSFLTVFFFLSS